MRQPVMRQIPKPRTGIAVAPGAEQVVVVRSTPSRPRSLAPSVVLRLIQRPVICPIPSPVQKLRRRALEAVAILEAPVLALGQILHPMIERGVVARLHIQRKMARPPETFVQPDRANFNNFFWKNLQKLRIRLLTVARNIPLQIQNNIVHPCFRNLYYYLRQAPTHSHPLLRLAVQGKKLSECRSTRELFQPTRHVYYTHMRNSSSRPRKLKCCHPSTLSQRTSRDWPMS